MPFAIRLMIPLQNTPDIPNFLLSKANFPKQFMRLCIYVLSYQLSYILSYLFQFAALHKSLLYPALVHMLYDEYSEDMTGEYSSAKYQ